MCYDSFYYDIVEPRICYSTFFTNHHYTTIEEHPERYGWWINELESLGLSVKKINELNDLNEIRDLAENIKQDYNTDYFDNGNPRL